MKKGLISIVIPTLNSVSHLQRLFQSLEKQTYKNFEVIVNDDKRSADKTKFITSQYNKKFRTKYIQKNTVTAYGRKMGADIAEGEYILHLDADMKLAERLLEEIIRKVVKDKCDVLIIPEISYGEGFWTKVKAFERSMYVGDDAIECARFATMVAYRAVGGHNIKMTFGEDKDFDIRVRKAGFKVCRTNEPIYHNEGHIFLMKLLKKKFYYGITSNVLFSTHPEYFLYYSNTIFRPAFFRNWRKLFNHPVLTLSMFFMKSLETIAGVSGLVYFKSPLASGDLKSKWR